MAEIFNLHMLDVTIMVKYSSKQIFNKSISRFCLKSRVIPESLHVELNAESGEI